MTLLITNCVYIVECHGFYKIGKTINLHSRLRELRTGNPFEIRLVHAIYSEHYSAVEVALHAIFREQHINGEWFVLKEEQVEAIQAMSVDEILSQANLQPASLNVRWDFDPAWNVDLMSDVPIPPLGTGLIVPTIIMEQAFEGDKPRRVLYGSFLRLLSTAWKSKYTETPILNEVGLMVYLKFSFRQYHTHKTEMEQLGWVVSRHPMPGTAQFRFPHAVDPSEISQ